MKRCPRDAGSPPAAPPAAPPPAAAPQRCRSVAPATPPHRACAPGQSGPHIESIKAAVALPISSSARENSLVGSSPSQYSASPEHSPIKRGQKHPAVIGKARRQCQGVGLQRAAGTDIMFKRSTIRLGFCAEPAAAHLHAQQCTHRLEVVVGGGDAIGCNGRLKVAPRGGGRQCRRRMPLRLCIGAQSTRC